MYTNDACTTTYGVGISTYDVSAVICVAHVIIDLSVVLLMTKK